MPLKQSWKKPLVIIGVAIVAIVGMFGLSKVSRKVKASVEIGNVSLSNFKESGITVKNKLKIPDIGNPLQNVQGYTNIKLEAPAWNALFPFMYANGDISTTKGSLMDSAKLNIKFIHQDDCSLICKDFVVNSQQLKDGTTTVPLFICLMGDGVMGYSTVLNNLKKLGLDWKAEVVYCMGRSAGEDAFWGPIEWKNNPKLALGKCVACVPRDGDCNDVITWCSMNGIPLNGNINYVDSFALNIIEVSDYNKELCDKINSGYSEIRSVYSHGKSCPDAGKHKCVIDAWASWTPADEIIAKAKGGFAKLASTKELTSQMPCVVIVQAAWASAHQDQMHKFIQALGKAGDQINSFNDAQEFAAQVSAKCYGSNDAGYWLKYYRGSIESDKLGNQVELGGSQAFNIADAANMFGIGNDTVDRYKNTYETFGNILVSMYPKDMPSYTPYNTMINKSYLKWVLDNNSELKNGVSEISKFKPASSNIVTNKIGDKLYNFTFKVNKSDILPASLPMLNEICRNSIIASGQTIFIYGHTDNSGDSSFNEYLSLERAKSVKSFLVSHCKINEDFIKTKGYGQTKPVNGTLASDPSNRCVEVIIGQ